MNAPDYPFMWRLIPRPDSKYPVRAANFAVIYCFITQTQKMGQKRPTTAALCLFLTIRPEGKNYEHEKICPSAETIDVKTRSCGVYATLSLFISLEFSAFLCEMILIPTLHSPEKMLRSPLPLVRDVGRPPDSRGLGPVRPPGECGR